jgi:uncharacterized protein
MKWFLASLLVLLWLCLPAQAQEAAKGDRPLMGSEATEGDGVLPPAPPEESGVDDGPFRILIAGDGLAGGLGAGMTRMAEDDAKIEIMNRFNESSGLARNEVYDWPSSISKIGGTKRIDAVVVLLGLNDRQTIRDGGARHDFKGPEWVKLYNANIDRLLEAAQSAKAKVYWISLPPMGDAALDADMRYISDLQRARVAEKGGQFIDVRPFFAAADGSYVDRGPDETGVERKLRARDGITFFKQGNNRFGQLVLGAIKTLDAAQPVVATAPPADKPAPDADKVKEAIAVAAPPSFGQQGIDGEDVTFRADAIRPLAPKPVSVAQRQPLGADTGPLRIMAKTGSASERLLQAGDIPAAPRGRFDDFSVPEIVQ